MHYQIVPVIMSGGSGTRLWPLSTADRPKQFHSLGAERTLIQETVARFAGPVEGVSFTAPIVIASARHAALVQQQLADIGVDAAEIILEPSGRNTAATAAVAAVAVAKRFPGALALLCPADHRLEDAASFRAAVARAAEVAQERICTFGIEPTAPATGYGYIQAGERIAEGVHAITAFKEKPSHALAVEYLQTGGYYWNAGVFLFRPAVLLREFDSAAAIRDIAAAAYHAAALRDGASWLPEAFNEAPSLPIDIAVMERTRLGAVAPCAVGWADIGSWSEVHRLSAQDPAGNASTGPVILHEARDCLVLSEGPLVSLLGVEGLVVVATKDAVMILPKERAQEAKRLCEAAQLLEAARKTTAG